MKRWYLFYTDKAKTHIIQQFVEGVQSTGNHVFTKLYQLGKELGDEKLYQLVKTFRYLLLWFRGGTMSKY